MPAIVAEFVKKKSFQSIADKKDDLLTAIKDDVAKYSRVAESKYLRHVIEFAPYHIGERLTYDKFGNSQYRTREIKHAFDLLEYAMIVQRVYGSHSTELPIQPNFRVAPKLLYLDSGLAVHKLGLTHEMMFVEDLNALFKGKLSEQVVGQAFASQRPHQQIRPCFWCRNKAGSVAEVDYSYQFKDKIVPVEVKSCKSGSLKSLRQFILSSPVNLAARFYSGELLVDKVSINGRSYTLFSIPFYLQWRIDELLADLC